MQAPLSSGSASSSVASKLYSQSVTTEIVAQVSKLPQTGYATVVPISTHAQEYCISSCLRL